MEPPISDTFITYIKLFVVVAFIKCF